MLLNELCRTDFTSYEDYKENFALNIPEHFNFAYDVVDEIARRDPHRPALVWCNDHGLERTFSFQELSLLSNKAANVFAARGIGKGDPVMVILKRRYQFWYALLGLHKLGAVAIPATHLLMKKDLVYRNNAADVKMILCVGDQVVNGEIEACRDESPTLEKLMIADGSRAGWLSFDEEVEAAFEEFERPVGGEAVCNDDTSLLYFTSGTTGYPKMVHHNFVYPLGHVGTAKFWQNCRDGGLHFTVSDTGWAKSVWGKIYGQWLSGSAVFAYDMEAFVPGRLLEVMSKAKVTTFCAPPTIYRFLIQENLADYDLSSLEYAVVAGEPLNPEVYSQFLAATGLKLREGYGQTELTLTIGTFPWMEPKPGSMGRPAPGYDVDILDPEGNPCENGEVGQIVLRTENSRPVGMFLGYYRDEEMTRKVHHDGIYYTGDTAWRDEDGYFWFVGRADDIIKSSGYRIGPFEVESALLEHPAVLECAVTGAPDPLRGQVVKATVVITSDYVPGAALVQELQDYVKRVTAPYKYPRIVEFVEELPKTISGKIRRVEIRDKDGREDS